MIKTHEMLDTEYREVTSTEDEYTIIKALLDAGEGFVSGSLLGEQLNMSRPAIWGKLEKLRDKGFEFEAVRNRGYRLAKEPEVIHPALIRYYGEKAGTDMDVIYFPVIDSTNSEAERQLSHRRKSPFSVTSSCQTKGRGRLGRDWHSASADNLYLSVVFEPNIPPQQLQHFTLWAGIYICRALQSLVPKAPLKIKWPNDLHCDGRKFAGMLTEAKMDADSIRSIVFGIGLNVNSNPAKYPEAIRKLATSLYAVNGKELPLNQVAAQVIAAIDKAYNVSIGNSPTEDLAEAWAPLSALAGQHVTAIMGGKEISGIASGIDNSGALLLKTETGTLHSIRAGDVTLKK
ncbi:MAG: biotin--[acetyl-CoA-carboxylase] ligase [Opitutales bacterium]|jgi:BirA family transcriptional regulator, biotin operon repressor / biotin---[acetyl-CoA-carboxylase] ligase|nr:biotin--[acetyl-CoA-carboxylase] ligase [Opitutales bacterium]MDP4644145.1 biotin--[acetyl-CoA-carboxylase] ligase [Opitutales bacterium]MDP4883781.1 biotin--[acetyl-CoA-carboxylase] ligase [Opitutales bacterium]MDP5080838.1 biotin--[acetyl-CoA-carboxylase] ligase [Opitutales bacterium]